MKNLFIAMSAMLLLASCGGNGKTEKEVVVNPLWGMWVQQEPAMDGKREIMFTEDNNGFVFVADTFYCKTLWREDSLLNIRFVFDNDSALTSVRKQFEMAIDADTLYLKDLSASEGEPVESRYVRFKQ
ncbi:MAG: hypothetical protein E7087_02990 [Bacteroidales bacterium]|nr:hypothetical protein [Bacteroidales bacterium]